MRRWFTLLVPFAMAASCAIPDIELVDSLGDTGGSSGASSGSSGSQNGGAGAQSGGSPSGGVAGTSGRGGTDGGEDGLGGTSDPGPGGAGTGGTAAGTGGTGGSGGTPPECSPDEVRCTADEEVESCVAGAWTVTEVCTGDTPLCLEGKCVVCTPQSQRCTQNVPERCSDDGLSWIAGEACRGETPACLATSGTCGRCSEDALQCDGDVVQRCDALGAWADDRTCSGALSQCVDGSCVECDPSDANGARRCLDESTPQLCGSNGRYQTEAECGGSAPVCRDETGRCACRDSDRRCQGATPQRCTNGLWASQTTCSGSTPVCSEATGGCVCQENALRCSGSVPERCTNGAWQARAQCNGDTPVCQGGSCVCRDGAPRCATQAGTSARERCSDGQWQTMSACSGTEPLCVRDGECGCTPQTLRCEDNKTVASCRNDSTWLTTRCGTTLSACDQGRCVAPYAVPGLLGCGGGLVCDSDEQCCYHATTSTGQCQADTPIGTTCATTGNDFEYDCDGPNDCPGGQVCCLTTYMRQVTQCIAAASCTGTTNAVVCDPSAGVSNNPVCASNQSCTGLSNGIIFRCN